MIPPIDKAETFLNAKYSGDNARQTVVWFLVIVSEEPLEQIKNAIKQAGDRKSAVAYVGPTLMAKVMGTENLLAISHSMMSQQSEVSKQFSEAVGASFPLKGVSPNSLLPGLLCLCGPDRSPLCVGLAGVFDAASVEIAVASIRQTEPIYAAECVAAAAQAE